MLGPFPSFQAPITVEQINLNRAIRNVRLRLERRGPCDDLWCPGWIISSLDRPPEEQIEKCDQCTSGTGLDDWDVALLPEAQRALFEFRAHALTQTGAWT